MEILEEIGKAIVDRRKELNVSQEELAKTTGISRHYLSDIENGNRAVSIPVIKKITSRLRWTLTELFSKIESEPAVNLSTVSIETGHMEDSPTAILDDGCKTPSSIIRLGEAISYYREREGLSREKLAEILCIKEERIIEIETGDTTITFLELERISLVLRTTLSSIINEVQKIN